MSTKILAAAVAALLLSIPGAAGAVPQTEPGRILNDLELRQALSGTGQADHAKLEAHFVALADRYAAEAARHQAMARTSPPSSSRSTGLDMRGHCTSLARLDTQLATTARALAKLHAHAVPGAPQPAAGKGMPKDMGARPALSLIHI